MGVLELGEMGFPGTMCDIESEHVVLFDRVVGLPELATVDEVIVEFACNPDWNGDVGSGSKVNPGTTMLVVPEGHIAIPSMIHASVGLEHIRVGVGCTRVLEGKISSGSSVPGGGVGTESGGGGVANPVLKLVVSESSERLEGAGGWTVISAV